MDFLRGAFAGGSGGGGAAARLGSLLGLEQVEESAADRFASWLPYRVYLEDEQLFSNREGLGFMLEVLPQSGADDQMVGVLASLYSACPPGTGVQFHLLASPHVMPLLREYARLRTEDPDQARQAQRWGRPARNQGLFRTLARRRVEHLSKGALASLSQGFHYTVRDFRLMLSVALPGDADKVADREAAMLLRDGMAATLRAASLASRVCDATDLISWCSLFVNPDRLLAPDAPAINYDEGREVRDQIVDGDTIQDATAKGLLLSKVDDGAALEIRFLSIRAFPQKFGLWQMGSLIGDLMQPALQYSSPFLITMGVQILDPNATRSAVTANHLRATQNAGSKMAAVMPDVGHKAADWGKAASAIDAGGTLVQMYHEVAVFAAPEAIAQAEENAKAIWRARGFELISDVFMHRQALLASLPMTFTVKMLADLKKLKRTTRKTGANAIHLAPVMGEWRGSRTPVVVFGGRRGQLTALDLYDNEGNYNAWFIGSPGSGKSVALNDFAASYRGIGAQVWVIDLGRSLEKLCRRAGGMYLEFGASSRINLNPFSMVSEPRFGADGQLEGGIEQDIEMLKPMLAKMCSARGGLEDVQLSALYHITLRTFREHGRELTMTGVRDALKSGSIPELEIVNDQRIKDLAVLLSPFAEGGEYERYFEGGNNVDFANELMVIEMEELKRKPQLQSVVNSLLLFQITAQMYLTRDRKKLLMIDEVKQQLAAAGGDDPLMIAVIEEAARRARKYGGAIVMASQSAEDMTGSPAMEAAAACCDWTFLLRQKAESIEALGRSGRIVMDDHKKRLLLSLRTEGGAYSEMYVSSPLGQGVVRLPLDPYAHLLFSNKLADNQPLDALLAEGLGVDDAITTLLRRRGQP